MGWLAAASFLAVVDRSDSEAGRRPRAGAGTGRSPRLPSITSVLSDDQAPPKVEPLSRTDRGPAQPPERKSSASGESAAGGFDGTSKAIANGALESLERGTPPSRAGPILND